MSVRAPAEVDEPVTLRHRPELLPTIVPVSLVAACETAAGTALAAWTAAAFGVGEAMAAPVPTTPRPTARAAAERRAIVRCRSRPREVSISLMAIPSAGFLPLALGPVLAHAAVAGVDVLRGLERGRGAGHAQAQA